MCPGWSFRLPALNGLDDSGDRAASRKRVVLVAWVNTITMYNTSAALKAAEELVEALKRASTASVVEHHDLLKRVDGVRMALEQPYDIIAKQVKCINLFGALYSLSKLGVVDTVPAEGTITSAELAAAANTGPDTYAHNAASQAYNVKALGGYFSMCMDFNKVFMAFPDYVKSHAPDDVFDLKKSPFAYTFGKEGKTYYEVIDEDPDQRQVWNHVLQSLEKNMPIAGMFPFESLKAQVEKEPERAFMADIGGGKGQALLKLQESIPGVFGGKLILQDLPLVINTLAPEDIPDIEKMAYDTFTPQPVKSKPGPSPDAHVYFMRRLLHDFYNPVCVEILRNTVSSMGPDSRLIVCDMLVPEKADVNGSKELYWLDLNLMCISGKEKKLTEFVEIFDAVGLELVKVWPSGVGATVQLETRLKREGRP
ncbi:S-adenosyl-L-methionine-dependent methyltransferase [Podospora appendiculata]|uniref:S-adenosyl-L-methionine-dependent methyltransferase n=1 Tax=Podospora appendiculata TaxID=314037 RepID=A0AAE1CAQ9_9PEZI|nr:S-adenosyl-L-methionine-dependent methyltransferase [Podospora appendiculata]